ncbi:phosphoglycerate dehydrogenase [Luminiphilus sp.]|nr:phosphoglycerate dehydrogenase [Luminiphilus sp.]
MIDEVSQVAVCSRSFSRHQTLRQELLDRYKNVKFNDEGVSLKDGELVNFLRGCNKAIIALEALDKEIISALPDLNVIGKYGVGLDKLDFHALEKFDVRVGWAPGVNANSVAELALSFALTLCRNSRISQDVLISGQWRQIVGRELSAMTFGILGFGFVGSRLARLLRGFDTEILVCDVLDKGDLCSKLGCTQVSFEDLITKSDIVSLHTPLNASTRDIINPGVVKKMKDNSYIVNTARGGLVAESVLLDALKSGKLAGVGVDVFAVEPPPYAELISHPNCLATTHIGGSSQEAILAMGRAAIDGLDNHHPASFFKAYA